MISIERVQRFFSEDHKQIEGWFFPLDQLAFIELFSVQDQLQITGDVAEVGVYQGKSLALLSLLKSSDERLLGFDLFVEDHQQKTEQNVQKYGIDDGLSLIKGLTSEIAQDNLDEIVARPLRFLHIDAGHEYHEVLEQLYLFSPYLADRGVIAMDDYQDREFPGIEAAVLDFSEVDRPRRFVPFLASGNKLFMCFSPMASEFQKSLLDRPNLSDTCRLTRVRDFNILIMHSKLPVSSKNIVHQIDGLQFPKRPDDDVSLNQKSGRFSQLTFGSGE